MKRICLLVALIACCSSLTLAQKRDSCTEFKQLVKKTYNFDESRLSLQQKLAKEKDLDKFWKTVKARRKQFSACLRAAIQDPKSNPFFRYDGSNLLVAIEPTLASKALQVRIFTDTDLDMVGARRWVSVLSLRGTEGFDISQAAERWLSDPKARYTLPGHGDFEIDTFDGALLLYGSMNEAQATPALLKILSQPNHPAREMALGLLMPQATPQALQALAKIDTTPFSTETQERLKTFLSQPRLIEPRTKPKTTRAEFLKAFQSILTGDSSQFMALVAEVEDGERDVVTVMKPQDWPLLRKVRRRFVLAGSQHSISYYNDFTAIILTLVWKQGAVEGEPQVIISQSPQLKPHLFEGEE